MPLKRTFDLHDHVVVVRDDLDAVALGHLAVALLQVEVEWAGAREGDFHLEHLALVHRLVSNVSFDLRWCCKKGPPDSHSEQQSSSGDFTLTKQWFHTRYFSSSLSL